MKKQAISFLLCATLVLSGGAMAFAADNTAAAEAETPVAVATMNFTGTPIKLSLADAIKRMQTEGAAAQAAEISRQSDKAVAEGYSEAVITIKKALDATAGMMTESQVTAIDEKSKRLSRDFAKANLENNHKAELNKIEKNTVEMYYGVLLAKDNLTAAKDHLAIQKTLLANVQKKFNAGVAAKKDVLSAGTSVTNGESSLKSAEVAFNAAKMSFNVAMDYPLMQEVVLTDTLKEIDAPTVSLAAAIESAKKNRLEPKSAELSAQIQEIVLNNLKLTVATNSSTYLRQQVAYLGAKQMADNAPVTLEKEIRTLYMELDENKSALQSAKATVAFAKEGYRLAQISYDAGVSTLAEVQDAQLQTFKASQALSAATKDYDLTVYAYKYAQGVGTERIAF